MDQSILLIGGTGRYGQKIAKLLRKRNPDMPITLGGRDLEKTEAFAQELGKASALTIDIGATLSDAIDAASFRAVGLIGYDPTMQIIADCAMRGIPYMGIAGGAYELALDITAALGVEARAPSIIASHWFAGTVTIPTVLLAQQFRSITRIDIGILIDRGDAQTGAGAATIADFKRISDNCSNTLARQNRRYVWLTPEQAQGKFRRADGVEIEAVGSVSPDVLSIGAATGADNIHILEGFAMSAMRAGGGPAADEIYIRISGIGRSGMALEVAQMIACPREPYSLTAIGAVAILERISAVADKPLPPRLLMVENIFAAEAFVDHMKDEGAQFAAL